MRCALLLLLGVVFIAGNHQVEALNRNESQVYEQLLKYLTKQQTDSDKEDFNKIIEVLSFPQNVSTNSLDTFNLEGQNINIICDGCRAVVKTVIKMRKEGKTLQELTKVATDLCTSIKIQTEEVCKGFVELNAPIMIYIIDNVPQLSAESFCGVLLQSENKGSCPYEDERFEWSIDIPPKLSPKTQSSQKCKKGGKTFKIVHISDIHYDPAYEPYSLADCKELSCCRVRKTQKASPRQRSLYNDEATKGRKHIDSKKNFYLNLDYAYDVREARMRYLDENRMSNKTASMAGFWGDYRSCDTPWWAVDDGIDYIIKNHKSFDYVYYTGDTVDHGLWETTKELITDSIIKTTNKLKQAFGNKPIFQVIGNHESQPANQFAPTQVTDAQLSTAWLYNLLWEQWKQWLPAEAEATLKKGGYYTALAQPGLRIIVLNSNLCYRYNWWIHYDPKHSSEQLSWMVQILSQAEVNNEKVHILSHIPPGVDDCLAVYTREYKRIIERFADVITAEFNGHMHSDEFKIFYTKGDTQPILTAWNGGSLTTNANVNPNYRIYDVDSSSYDIVDMETWIYNLTEANLSPHQRRRWFLEYSFKKKYNVKSLRPKDMNDLLERLVSVDQDLLVNDYHRFRGKSSDHFVNTPCDNNCVKQNLYYITVTEIYDNKKYNEMNIKYLTNKQKQKPSKRS